MLLSYSRAVLHISLYCSEATLLIDKCTIYAKWSMPNVKFYRYAVLGVVFVAPVAHGAKNILKFFAFLGKPIAVTRRVVAV